MSTLPQLVLSLSLLASGSGLAAQETTTWRVPREARAVLVEMKATVHHGPPERDYTAELTAREVAELRRRGFDPSPLFERPQVPLTQNAGGYSSYSEMRDDFVAYAAAHPNIAQLEVLGLSVQGREIFGLKISGNVSAEEDEPELVFFGSIHGDEFASAEVPYLYALYLCDNYGVNPDVTQYVDGNEIWCIPMINPDGHEAGNRNNANNVDLNRDFGFQWDGWGGSSAPHSQIETRAVREFCLDNNIALSSTMHCSGNVFLHPWGFGPNATPDAGVIQTVGDAYTTAANYTLMSSWVSYETHGELVDYLYGSHGGLIYTAEISNSLGALATTYSRNEAGMNAFNEHVGRGLHGVITDAQSGAPLWAAVWIDGNSVPAYTDPQLGDLHRIVAPGAYDLTVWAPGYVAQAVSGVVVPGTAQPGQFQVALQRESKTHAFLVTAVNQRDPNNSYANRSAPANALGGPDGRACSLGAAGFIVLDMGSQHAIVDAPGDDFTVTEAMLPGDSVAEAYRVFAGDAYVQDQLIGVGLGTTSFDLGNAGVGSTRYLKIVDESGANPNASLAGVELDGVTVLFSSQAYCTSGTSANGCVASMSSAGSPSASASSGFDLLAAGVEGAKDGLFFFGTNGRQANPWGSGTSYQCVVPPVSRAGLMAGAGTQGQCDGAFAADLNALWCPSCPKPAKNPGAGTITQAQLWYRDPMNTSNRTTSLSNALEFTLAP
jgi:hypothetical protein